MRLTREFEPGSGGAVRIDIFGKREHLKSAAEHFGMQQCLEGAFGFGIGSAVNWLQAVGRLRCNRSGQVGDDAGKEMVLIGESRDAQSVCFRATGNACPIDVHRDVRVTDLFKGRIEMSMLGADLNISLKFIARMSVVDGDHVASLQICCDTVDPIERSLIKRRV